MIDMACTGECGRARDRCPSRQWLGAVTTAHLSGGVYTTPGAPVPDHHNRWRVTATPDSGITAFTAHAIIDVQDPKVPSAWRGSVVGDLALSSTGFGSSVRGEMAPMPGGRIRVHFAALTAGAGTDQVHCIVETWREG